MIIWVMAFRVAIKHRIVLIRLFYDAIIKKISSRVIINICFFDGENRYGLAKVITLNLRSINFGALLSSNRNELILG